MSRSDDTTEDLRRQVGNTMRMLHGMVRRFQVSLTSGALWQGIGILLLDNTTRETVHAEPFTGIGFYSRPAPGVNAEFIVAHLGEAQNPMIVATRDEDTRKRVAKIDQDETMTYNTQVGVRMTKDGEILACAHGGTPVELAKASELNDLRAYVHAQFSGVGHGHPAPGGATTGTTPNGAAPASDYPGTSVLKGE
jgi:hypothetical protein